MNKHGKSLVTIMLSIALTALALRIAVEQVMRFTIAKNEAEAQSVIKLIAKGLENHAKDNKGAYPSSLAALTSQQPPYLEKDYIALSPVKGYTYSCPRLDGTGYSCYAQPVKCGVTGSATYSVTTGGIFVSDECSKKEWL